MDGDGLHFTYEGANALGCQIGITTGEFGAQWDIRYFRKDGVTEEKHRLARQDPLHAGGSRPAAADQGLHKNHGIEDNAGMSQRWFR